MLLPHSRIFPVNTFQVCFLFRDQSPSEHFLCRCTLQQRTDQSVESRYTQPRPPTNGLTCGENNRLNTDRKWMESPFRNEWWNEMKWTTFKKAGTSGERKRAGIYTSNFVLLKRYEPHKLHTHCRWNYSLITCLAAHLTFCRLHICRVVQRKIGTLKQNSRGRRRQRRQNNKTNYRRQKACMNKNN